MTKVEKKSGQSAGVALLPYSLWSLLFILVPLVFTAYYAFTDNNFAFTTENITRFFTATSEMRGDDGVIREVRTYLVIFMRSLKLAAISTLVCLVLGYPMAYIMARAKERTQKTGPKAVNTALRKTFFQSSFRERRREGGDTVVL